MVNFSRMRFLPGVLVTTLPLAFAFTALVAGGAYWQISSVFKQELAYRMERESTFAVNEVETRIAGLGAILRTMSRNAFFIDTMEGDRHNEAHVREFFEGLSLVPVPGALVGLTDASGRVLVTNGRARIRGDIELPPGFADEVSHLALSQEKMTVAVPVLSGGVLRGSVFARFGTDALVNYLNLSYSNKIIVLTINGLVIATDSEMAEILKTPANRFQEDWITQEAASALYPALGVRVFARRDDLFAALRGLDRTLITTALANLAILLAGLVLAALLVGRPLARLASEVRSVREADDLTRNITVGGYLEVARLAEAFNAMMANLRSTLVSHEQLARENRYRQQVEQSLRDKQAENAAIVETVHDAIIVIDKHGEIRSANPATSRILGYSNAELVGSNVSMLMPEPHRSRHDQYLHNFLKTGEAKIIGIGRELEACRQDGEKFPIELYVAAITLKAEPHFVGVIRDVTERRKVDRMQREFIALVSHELRTPLTSLTGSLRLITSGNIGEVPERIARLLHLAQNNAMRLIDLVNDIMVVEKLQAGVVTLKMEPVDLLVLARSALEDTAQFGDKFEITFELRTSLKSAWSMGDGRRLTQVLVNLLTNAVKFSEPGSVVEIHIEKRQQCYRLAVRDHGIGIPTEAIEDVFSKFVQLDTTDAKNGQGSGLGLAIAQAIMELHGTRIEVDSQVGAGSTFYFDLIEFQQTENAVELSSLTGDLLENSGTSIGSA
ncbi:PAS domain S-box protein [Breoghania sp.]|uniref:PAS domain S-box protein n=1 Tax=Breoghania sp. TaxID=2065378 RepID=UPI002AAB5FEE|nr:PAS domain S-box protein [Breoghania sp.]